ncbi:thiol peroxidase [Prolixibacter denitrificans]|uniref:Thiol peroxidase n=1 Tax=Prolixibacter denitrificans TaxID=1541063 RepID=A0A2P8CBV3_9BACT|nr:thiol peroxidase [Prolixibacter denitrificans]PSK82453.1 thiol peroxidase, atypical 2-Cys peroxiredoxin [Prolixibacter denitrificans]GET22805.1 putative thiol peroxidase [Prolixibacter denitrificans]
MKENAEKVTFAGNPVTLVGDEIKVGQKAPEFTVVGADLSPVKLSDYAGKVVVIAVYPSIDTGVCAAQNRRFNAEADKLGDAVVLSVSCDLPFAQKRFCGAEGLDNIVTLSDHRDTDFGLKYGYLIKELRLLARGTVIIDKDGTIKYVEFVSEITNEPDYDSALKVVKELL